MLGPSDYRNKFGQSRHPVLANSREPKNGLKVYHCRDKTIVCPDDEPGCPNEGESICRAVATQSSGTKCAFAEALFWQSGFDVEFQPDTEMWSDKSCVKSIQNLASW